MLYGYERRVGYTDTGIDYHMTLESLISACQDCTAFHSEDSGIGIRALRERGLAWVISAWNVVIRRRPELCENIRVETIPYEIRGIFGLRNFVIRDQAGCAVFWADSTWVMVDTERMRPVRVPDDVGKAYGRDPRYDMKYENRKIFLPEGGTVVPDIVVGAHHLDANGHVNNVKYIGMALDSSGISENEVATMRVEYLKQAFLGDVIHPRVVREENRVYVGLGGYCNVEFVEDRP